MAMSDYYLCDMCSKKTFYDANLDYDNGDGMIPFGVGCMKVICTSCCETHDVTIKEKDND